MPLLQSRLSSLLLLQTTSRACSGAFASSSYSSTSSRGRSLSSSSTSSNSVGVGEGRIGADDGQVAELLEANLARPARRRKEDAPQHHPRVLTARREALALYREVLRYSNLFVWRDERGRVWRDVIRASARQEYEAARREQVCVCCCCWLYM
jgi:hypothetical protein